MRPEKKGDMPKVTQLVSGRFWTEIQLPFQLNTVLLFTFSLKGEWEPLVFPKGDKLCMSLFVNVGEEQASESWCSVFDICNNAR